MTMCSCGGVTSAHKVIKRTKTVAEYEECEACGRVLILWTQREVHLLKPQEEDHDAPVAKPDDRSRSMTYETSRTPQ